MVNGIKLSKLEEKKILECDRFPYGYYWAQKTMEKLEAKGLVIREFREYEAPCFILTEIGKDVVKEIRKKNYES